MTKYSLRIKIFIVLISNFEIHIVWITNVFFYACIANFGGVGGQRWVGLWKWKLFSLLFSFWFWTQVNWCTLSVTKIVWRNSLLIRLDRRRLPSLSQRPWHDVNDIPPNSFQGFQGCTTRCICHPLNYWEPFRFPSAASNTHRTEHLILAFDPKIEKGNIAMYIDLHDQCLVWSFE